ncbi:hypothetical protein F5050DRAFT_1716495 [Lentinula boryana]|uniref:Uncharacterized protein n=1 Tax=Lentinula boryana TaxID=40481 RepID=A0ABQ8PWX6_9AGAR|nr:hypothetical protein F5050DRAFT_1716495 [Lentinula boryana]
MASHGYNTRGNQPGRSDLITPGATSPNSPHQEGGENITVSSTARVSGVNNSEPKRMDSPLTSIASNNGPSIDPSAPAGPEDDLSAPAGPEKETAPAGPDITASDGPDIASPVGDTEQEGTSAGRTAGGRDEAMRNNAPELLDFRLPPPIINPTRNEKKYFDDKMKGPDARNWGNAGLEDADTDPEVQAQILRSLQSTRDERQMFSYLEHPGPRKIFHFTGGKCMVMQHLYNVFVCSKSKDISWVKKFIKIRKNLE